jgi:hypothetical protein
MIFRDSLVDYLVRDTAADIGAGLLDLASAFCRPCLPLSTTVKSSSIEVTFRHVRSDGEQLSASRPQMIGAPP